MALKLETPIIYLITSGETTPAARPSSAEFTRLLKLIEAAVTSQTQLVQLREKNLRARTLYELTARAASITRGSDTRLLVNDRADIALAAGADGVHLTTRSLEAHIIRRTFPENFLIGVSTHSLEETQAAYEGGANFAVFGPVFETPSKLSYGPPVGLAKLSEASQALPSFPLIALGGITRDNAREALRAGARGIAAIRLLNDPNSLDETVRAIRYSFRE
ncbi:MAG: thiamine phosphate synthase [Pyrinomonadaceae bacterium]